MNAKHTTAPLCKAMEQTLPIGGFLKQSLIDYPGNISAVLFTRGCNFRCTYCHNPDLVYPDLISKTEPYDCREIFDWIEKNSILLDAVVITGGEPTMHSSLKDSIVKIKSLGLKVKLDTNGTNPELLQQLIAENLLDYVAMDIKAPLNLTKYQQVVGQNFDENQMKRVLSSVELLLQKQPDCEFRTTQYESASVEDIRAIAGEIKGNYFIQKLRQNGVVLTSDSFLAELQTCSLERDDLKVGFR